MTDFKIKRGLSSVVFSEPGIINPNLIIEEGTWYLCTDTAELYLGITVDGELTLKQINGEHGAPTEGETTTGIVDAYIKEETGELWVVFADGSEKALGSVAGASETVSIKIGENTFEAVDGIIELPKVNLDDYAKLTDIPTDYIKEIPAEYITANELADELAKIEHPTIDLASYATKDDIKDFAKKVEVEEVKTKLEDEVLPTVQELAEKAATQEWVQEQGYLTEHQSLEDYAKKADIPEDRLFVVDFSDPDFTVAFEAYNSGKLLLLTNAAPDPTGYAVMNYAREDKISFTKFLMSRSETYGTFNTYYLSPDNTWEVSREVKLNKVEITENDKLQVGKQELDVATKEFVAQKIAEAELSDKDIDLEAYYTKSEVDALIPDISGFIKEIPEEYITESELEAKGYLTEHQSLEDYAKKSDIPEAELYKVDFNAPDYAEAVEAYNNGKVLVLINAAPDTSSYALMNYVSDSYITFTKFLTNRSETYGAFNTYYLSVDNTWEVSKEVKISKVEANVEGEIAGQLTTIKINKEIYSLPSVEGLASEEFVNEAIASIEIPEVDLTGYATEKFVEDAVAGIEIPDAYDDSELRSLIDSKADTEHTHDQYLTEHQDISHLATKEEIPDVSEFITSIPEEYITNDELEAKGYLTEHQSLEDYATEEYVVELIEGIEIPETDLSEYSKTEEMNAAIKLATDVKADDIPFAESKIVGKDVGRFKAGDDVKDLTIAQILAKLLELSDNNVTPEEPEIPSEPDEPQGIIETILANEIAMYEIDDSDVIQKVDYQHVNYTASEHAARDDQNCFYTLLDTDNNVIEAGYQHFSTPKDPYYIIALPDYLEVSADGNVEMQSWNILENRWQTVSRYTLTDDYEEIVDTYNADGIEPPVAPEGYKLWADLSTGDPGCAYRFIIKE